VLIPLVSSAAALKTGNAFREAISYTKAPPLPVRVVSGRGRRRCLPISNPPLNLEKIEKVEKEEARLWRNKDAAEKKEEARLKRKKQKEAKDLMPKYHKVEEGQVLFTEALKIQVSFRRCVFR
jgi:hypothetical protein